jgi:deoxyribodipyrimidine photo-lyase
MKQAISVFWFRRDLRWQDNVGLYHALYQAKLGGHQVLPIFIFDKHILDQLEDTADRRVDFIHQTLTRLQDDLVPKGKTLWVRYGKPLEVFESFLRNLISSLFILITIMDPKPMKEIRPLKNWQHPKVLVFIILKTK